MLLLRNQFKIARAQCVMCNRYIYMLVTGCGALAGVLMNLLELTNKVNPGSSCHFLCKSLISMGHPFLAPGAGGGL